MANSRAGKSRNTEPEKGKNCYSSSLRYLRGEKEINKIPNGNAMRIQANSYIGRALGLTKSIQVTRFKNELY
jgi:hypothetical protein